MEALVDVEDNLSVDPCLAWKQLCSKAGRREVEVLNGSHNTVVVGTDQEYLASYFNCKFKALHSYIIMRTSPPAFAILYYFKHRNSEHS